MKFFSTLMALMAIIATLLVTSGCSSVRPLKQGRRGLFDQIGKPVSSRNSPDEVDQTYHKKPVKWRHGDKAAVVAQEKVDRDLVRETKSWVWPLSQVQLTSQFGARDGSPHEGIDLQAKKGTPVFAVDDALVLYSGKKISGYGLMLVLRHSKGLSTVYAHNSKLLVKGGEKVKRGQKIAVSGATGRVSGPHLHFEVRDGVQAVDPMQLLSLTQNSKPSVNAYAQSRGETAPKGPSRRMASVGRKGKKRL